MGLLKLDIIPLTSGLRKVNGNISMMTGFHPLISLNWENNALEGWNRISIVKTLKNLKMLIVFFMRESVYLRRRNRLLTCRLKKKLRKKIKETKKSRYCSKKDWDCSWIRTSWKWEEITWFMFIWCCLEARVDKRASLNPSSDAWSCSKLIKT